MNAPRALLCIRVFGVDVFSWYHEFRLGLQTLSLWPLQHGDHRAWQLFAMLALSHSRTMFLHVHQLLGRAKGRCVSFSDENSKPRERKWLVQVLPMYVDKLKRLPLLSPLFFHCIALPFWNKYLIQNKQSLFQAYVESFWEMNFISLFSFSSFVFFERQQHCFPSSTVVESKQNDTCETPNTLWSVIQRKRNYSGFHKTFFYQCWWLLLFKIYLHRTRELENLFRTLSAATRPWVGFTKGWASAPVTSCGQLDLLSVMLTQHVETKQGIRCGRWPEPHATSHATDTHGLDTFAQTQTKW